MNKQKNKRNALPSLKGYLYQPLYLIKLFFDDYNNDNVELTIESGNEDIDKNDNGKITSIQLKYSGNKTQGISKTSEIFKVIKSNINKTVNNINVIVKSDKPFTKSVIYFNKLINEEKYELLHKWIKIIYTSRNSSINVKLKYENFKLKIEEYPNEKLLKDMSKLNDNFAKFLNDPDLSYYTKFKFEIGPSYDELISYIKKTIQTNPFLCTMKSNQFSYIILLGNLFDKIFNNETKYTIGELKNKMIKSYTEILNEIKSNNISKDNLNYISKYTNKLKSNKIKAELQLNIYMSQKSKFIDIINDVLKKDKNIIKKLTNIENRTLSDNLITVELIKLLCKRYKIQITNYHIISFIGRLQIGQIKGGGIKYETLTEIKNKWNEEFE
jgi:hypothetical protein